MAIALRTATSASVEGMGEASIRALVKLQRLLPSRLRERVESLRVAALPLPADGGHIDPELLVTIAGACRNGERVRFSYEAHSGSTQRRRRKPKGPARNCLSRAVREPVIRSAQSYCLQFAKGSRNLMLPAGPGS